MLNVEETVFPPPAEVNGSGAWTPHGQTRLARLNLTDTDTVLIVHTCSELGRGEREQPVAVPDWRGAGGAAFTRDHRQKGTAMGVKTRRLAR